MTLAEAESFMEGYERKCRTRWEMLRRLVHAVYQSQSTRELYLEDVLHFPWDEGHDDIPEDNLQSIEDLRIEARKIENLMRQKDGIR